MSQAGDLEGGSGRSRSVSFGTNESSAPYECCRVRIDGMTPTGAVARLLSAARDKTALCVHLCNAFTLSLAQRDPAFADLLNDGDLNLADGVPVAWFGRWVTGGRVAGPVPGPSLMRAVFNTDSSRSVRHFLLGSSTDVLASLQTRIRAEFPGTRIVGAFSPPVTDDVGVLADLSSAAIKGSEAELVWVGLGTPKQDWVAAALAERLRVVVVPVGAAFDFMAGTTREAPAWLRGTGLEWLFRLMTEPRRLWRRYLVGNSVFIAGAIKSAWRARRPTAE